MQQEKIIGSLKRVDFSDLWFPMIVVYKNPKDSPEAYVARVWEAARNLPTNTLIKRETLKEIRRDIREAGFTTRIARQQGDDPVIVETWDNGWRSVWGEINTMEELSVNISFCPYCGSENIGREDDVNCYCDECGRDFKIMTHE